MDPHATDATAYAKQLVATYNPEGQVPFPFERIIDAAQDVELLVSSGMDEDVSGAIVYQPESKRFTILINPNRPEVRRYFTMAHEVGHYYLHRDWLMQNSGNGFVDDDSLLDVPHMLLRSDQAPSEAATEMERAANNFAAELIMPEDKVRDAWTLTGSVDECATIFRVSTVAMSVRLQRLGLVA